MKVVGKMFLSLLAFLGTYILYAAIYFSIQILFTGTIGDAKSLPLGPWFALFSSALFCIWIKSEANKFRKTKIWLLISVVGTSAYFLLSYLTTLIVGYNLSLLIVLALTINSIITCFTSIATIKLLRNPIKIES